MLGARETSGPQCHTVAFSHVRSFFSVALRVRNQQRAAGTFYRRWHLRSKSVARLVLSLSMCLGIGILESLVTRPEIPTWYAALTKPSWTPPPLVFPIVWTALYVLMGVSFWRLWESEPGSQARSMAMFLFMGQLALNAAWSPVFFGWHCPVTALVIIATLLPTIGATIVFALRVDRVSALLLAPYFAWVAYASTINAGVVVLN